jgi:hypothetical protein
MPESGHDRRVTLSLFVAGLVYYGLIAWLRPDLGDWDAQYYGAVARNIVDGKGAVTLGLWNLSFLPASLPAPADMHWMPLPSWVLVPGVALWEHGDLAITVILCALWAPLAAHLATLLGGGRREALIAGIVTLLGAIWAGIAPTTDCYALYGAIGGLASIALVRQSWQAMMRSHVATASSWDWPLHWASGVYQPWPLPRQARSRPPVGGAAAT